MGGLSADERSGPAWEDPRTALRRHGLAPKRSFSQNFLVSKHAVEAIAEAVGGAPGERVVELGPGLGTLTAALLRRGLDVVAIERDRDMAAVLRHDLPGPPRLEILEADAGTFDFGALAEGDGLTVAGNLPYAITGAIFRRVVEQAPSVKRAVFMIQREVGLRLVAEPGTSAYGALTVFTAARFDIGIALRVPAGAFHPPPKVESVVVSLERRETPRATIDEAFERVVRASFQARRKTLRNGLKQAGYGTAAIDAAYEACGLEARTRGERLSPEAFDQLTRALEAANGA